MGQRESALVVEKFTRVGGKKFRRPAWRGLNAKPSTIKLEYRNTLCYLVVTKSAKKNNMVTKTTEREITGWLNGEINGILSQGGYPFKESTIETGLSGKTYRFPDIVIWFDRSAKHAFAFIEVKPPGQTEDTGRIPEVASRLNVSYAITWNFSQAVLYHVTEKLEIKKPYHRYLLATLEEWVREDKRVELRKYLRDFLDDLRELYGKGHLHRFPPDKHYFIKLLRDTKDSLRGYFEQHLSKAMQKKDFKKTIDAFLVEQGIPDMPDTRKFLAEQWAYGLITRILFYLTVRRQFVHLPDIIKESRSVRSIDKLMRRAYAEARNVDWQAVFEAEDPIEKVGIPKSCNSVLTDLMARLDEYNFAELGEDVIGEVFEELIPDDEKHRLGQYFTREDLVDFIIGFVVQSSQGNYIDPTCGSGTFLNRLYSRIKWQANYSKPHMKLLSQIWGIDIAKFPAGLATINLFRQEIRNYANFPRITVKDFFEITSGQKLEFHLPKRTSTGTSVQEITLPHFAGMVGNFPFIRQEQIEKKKKGYKNKLTKRLALDWFHEYRVLFEQKKIRNAELENSKTLSDTGNDTYFDRLVKEKKIDLKLSGQADMYAYLFLHCAKFLERDGRMGFITSNSWLDVGYGFVLKKFFLDHFKIVAIVCSWTEPWFHFASVNTIFTIVERCDDANQRNENYVRFVKVKKKLEELIPYRELSYEESQRWGHIDGLVRKIEYGKIPDDQQQIASVEDDDFRIRAVKQEYLLKELEREKQFCKWGKYLRAPNVYFEILEKTRDYLIPLKDLLGTEIRFGIKTGINDFFYLEPTGEKAKRPRCLHVKNAQGWTGDIETRFLKPVIKSPKEADKIVIDPKKLRYKLFMCNLSKQEIKKRGYTGALKYIEWGEQKRTKDGVLWPKVPSVKGRKYWWSLGDRQSGSILMQMVNDDRFLVFLNEGFTYVDHNLFEFSVTTEEARTVAALLNSSISALNREIVSRVNLGDGATKTEGVDWKNNVFLFDYSKFTKKHTKKILSCFDKLLNRPIYPIEKEVKRKDRQEFDRTILESIGLDPDKYLKRLYTGLTELVHERLSLPKMRKKMKNAKVQVSIDQIKKQVEQEIIYGGLRDFPNSFVEKRSGMRFIDISTTGLALRIGHHFFGKYEVVDEEGKLIHEADSLETARYIICAHRPDETIINVPKSKIAINKATIAYERYIKGIHEKFVRRAFSATHDHDMADRIALELLRENGYTGNFELG
jgi:type I restriction-modification system DNA methylase subunit